MEINNKQGKIKLNEFEPKPFDVFASVRNMLDVHERGQLWQKVKSEKNKKLKIQLKHDKKYLLMKQFGGLNRSKSSKRVNKWKLRKESRRRSKELF